MAFFRNNRRAIAAEPTGRILSQPSARFASYEFFDSAPFEFFPAPPNPGFGGIIPFLGRLLRRCFQLVLLFALSVISYRLFYYSVLPTISADVPLYFDYTGVANVLHLNSSYTREMSNFSVPWAAADLFARHSSWQHLEVSDVLPAPVTTDRLLVPRQPYFVDILLELPDSEVNRRSGVIGVVVELRSHNGTGLAVSRRSARFPHQSNWIRTLQKVCMLIPLLLGAVEESQTVWLSPYRHFVESTDFPMRHVWVQILTMGGQLVEVAEGHVRIGKELNAFQELLKYHYFTCATIGTCIFASLYFFLWSLLAVLWEDYQRRHVEQEPPCELDENDDFHFDDLHFDDYEDNEHNADENSRRPTNVEGSEGDHRTSPGGESDGPVSQDDGRAVSDDEEDDQNGEWQDLFFDSCGHMVQDNPSRDPPYS